MFAKGSATSGSFAIPSFSFQVLHCDRILCEGINRRDGSGSFVSGEVGRCVSLKRENQASIADRSYVCPSIAVTGSSIKSPVIQQQSSLGGSNSSTSFDTKYSGAEVGFMLNWALFFWSLLSRREIASRRSFSAFATDASRSFRACFICSRIFSRSLSMIRNRSSSEVTVRSN
jgi:hypothetical protein